MSEIAVLVSGGLDSCILLGDALLEDVAALISAAERRAMAAERDTVDRLVAIYLSERTGQTFDGRISGVVKAGLFVQLPKFGADGFIPVSSSTATTISTTRPPAPSTASAPAKAFSWPTASRSGWSKCSPSPAACASRC